MADGENGISWGRQIEGLWTGEEDEEKWEIDSKNMTLALIKWRQRAKE